MYHERGFVVLYFYLILTYCVSVAGVLLLSRRLNRKSKEKPSQKDREEDLSIITILIITGYIPVLNTLVLLCLIFDFIIIKLVLYIKEGLM